MSDEEICQECSAHQETRSETPPPLTSAPESFAPQAPESTSFWQRHYQEYSESCHGKLWIVRFPLLAYFAFAFYRSIASSGPYRSLFDSLNLGIHELGHALFKPLGDYMSVAGGTITQCAAPIITLVMFYRQRDYFAMSVAVCWLATNFWGVAVYMGDARALKLNLVSPGMGMMPASEGGIIHDWNYLLGETGLLRHDTTMAGGLHVAATLLTIAGLLFGALTLWKMAKSEECPLKLGKSKS